LITRPDRLWGGSFYGDKAAIV